MHARLRTLVFTAAPLRVALNWSRRGQAGGNHVVRRAGNSAGQGARHSCPNTTASPALKPWLVAVPGVVGCGDDARRGDGHGTQERRARLVADCEIIGREVGRRNVIVLAGRGQAGRKRPGRGQSQAVAGRERVAVPGKERRGLPALR